VLRDDVQHTYDRFLGRVAEGRKLETAAIDKVARGRVWTGEQALAIGLVDRLGGIPEAVLAAKEKVGLDADADVLLVQYHRPSPWRSSWWRRPGGAASLELSAGPRARELVAARALRSVRRS
jgi:ClpP class serine protease